MSDEKKIQIYVNLDKNRFPSQIEWEATDAGFGGRQPTNSFLLSVWDNDKQSALALNLWNDKMLVEDMNMHFFQTFHAMADSYRTATGNIALAQAITQFAQQFGEMAEEQAKKADEQRAAEDAADAGQS